VFITKPMVTLITARFAPWVDTTSISDITEPPRRLFFRLFTAKQANAATSPTRTSRLHSNKWLRSLTIPQRREFPSSESILTPYAAEEQMHSRWQVSPILGFKRWAGGGGPPSRSMCARNSRCSLNNVAGNSMYDITESIIASEYTVNATLEHAAVT
jgi:hypothetical protein